MLKQKCFRKKNNKNNIQMTFLKILKFLKITKIKIKIKNIQKFKLNWKILNKITMLKIFNRHNSNHSNNK